MKTLFFKFKHFCYLIIVAWMLGVSNAILEETRMVNDTRAIIEHIEEIDDTSSDDNQLLTQLIF